MTPVVVIPAMGVPARHYGRLATALTARGHDVRTVPLPGGDEAGRPSRRRDAGYRDLVEGPVAAEVDAARAGHGGAPVTLVGHSLGGQLVLLFAARHPEAVAAVALPAAGTVHWRAFRPLRGLAFLAFAQLAALTAAILGSWPGDRLGFGGRQPARLIREWARVARTGRFEPTGARDVYGAGLVGLACPILSITIPGDRFAPASAARALAALAPRAPTEHVELPADAFDAPVDHLRWLRAPEPVARTIADWLVGNGATTMPAARVR